MRDLGLLILRVAVGAMLMVHGWGKLVHLAHGNLHFANPIGIGPVPSLCLAAFAEFFCSALVALGLWTRLAAIPVVITMAVAGLVQQWAAPWSDKELALLYLAAFLSLALMGPGRFSFDGAGRRGKRSRA
jgi:putative oxidoreductase